MRVVPKLTLALFCASSIVLAVNGWLRVRREVAYFEATRSRDHEMIGRSLAATVAAVWRSDGREPALATVAAVNEHFTRIHIRWLDDDGTRQCPPSDAAITTCVVRERGEPTWYTYQTVDVAGVRRGAIELSESATTEQVFTHSVVVETLATALALALLATALSFFMGQWLVGRPVRALVDKARRIGQADFSSPLVYRASDELGWLSAELNATSDRLATTLAQLRHADRLATVGTLASGVAHELGTPLNVVTARASMIADEETTLEENRESAGAIQDAAARMTRIIQQLLRFARRTGPQRAGCDLRRLAADALDLLRPLAAKADVALELVEGDVDASIAVDAAQLQQVVTNLVINAVHAMPRGGTARVEIDRARAHAPGSHDAPRECLRLIVSDEGEGIAPEDLPHIFEPFFTTKDVGEGTGLGLPVSYGIVRDHGGWIAVESELAHGTRFVVYLPKEPP